MNKGVSLDNCVPKFFKVYLPDESGDDMVLPISFTRFLPKSLPETVTVRSISGNIWKLELKKCCGDDDTEKFVMVNGWKRIVKDEDLKGGDFLEFEFDGSSCFHFCIYEHRTMCKKIRRSSDQSEEIKVESDSDEQNQASDDVLSLDEDDDDSDYNCGEDNDSDDYADEAAVEKDDNDADDEDADDDDEDERQYLDDRENPSFTLILNPKKKSQLLIPARVIKDYDLHFPESITLVDPLVKKFGTLEKQIKIQTNGSVFVKGFGSIIRRNKVKTTDKMIFEIKKTGDNNLVQTIKIHIISG
ncbi:AP2/B3-like transcriptional factor family protein [Arabidopsis thaliana]|uniref:AP2/B3-like transcriptional factor family protein n=1 Tax=Arabidopsis thaliana TaxID=3702 RepID=UPI0001E93173|nr:AP2/B3-like transcriptional factor family protein [Arabidopsis thaliana]AED97283.1 AP2/B3-like transcriptional factor family protein [Arabidopsis thaliana]|eukprot:NP_001190577.1 AP2/B3-like transcriptional factor family protein [Arabidopsis thaliana]